MDKINWSERIAETISQLKSITSAEFYDEASDRYHPAGQDIDDIISAFEIDLATLQELFTRNLMARQRWLPSDPTEIASMDAKEVLWRLGENSADERWVDGALVDTFESGSLIAALERIKAEIESAKLAPKA
jgi:hypothetical protein